MTSIETIDENRDTWISIGCWRETYRLERMLRVFQVALTLARKEGKDGQLCRALMGLHDSKGVLTATWQSPEEGFPLTRFVNQAWEEEGEHSLIHEDAEGRGFARSEHAPITT